MSFSSANIESISEIKKIINQFYDPRRSGDSAFVDGNELMICEDQDTATDDDEDWVMSDCESREKNRGEWRTIHNCTWGFVRSLCDTQQLLSRQSSTRDM